MQQHNENKKNTPEISFVIPCLNEEKTLKGVIENIKRTIDLLKTPCEIIVSDNGSTDNSIEIAKKEGVNIFHAENKGYGNALIQGLDNAQGEFIVMGDADGTYDFSEAIPFIEKLRSGADFVIGSRIRGNIERGAMPFLHRYLGTPVLTFLLRSIFKVKITDCNCGLRAFTKKAYEQMNMISGGMEFASEMIIKAGILKLNVKEIPCSLYKDTRDRKPHLNTWWDGWRHLKFILTFAPDHLFKIPGLFFFITGLIITAVLGFGTFEIGNIVFDYHFMFVASFFLLAGYQFIWLAKFGKTYIDFAGFFKRGKQKKVKIEIYMIIAFILVFTGLFSGILLLNNWVKNDFIVDLFHKRLLAITLDLLFLGIMTFLNAFIIGLLNTKLRK